jgi:MFS family permease
MVRRAPVYYGWIILAIGTLGFIMTSPGQTYAVSIFIEYFIVDLNISRSMVSTLYMVGTLTASLAMPLVGRQIDHRGSRAVVAAVSALFGLACIYMGFVSNAIMLGIGFILLRGLGQGSLQLVSSNVINRWWIRRRGLVMGIAGTITSLLGFGAFPNLLNWMIPQIGWRLTYGVLGGVQLLIMLPLGTLLFRNQPEDHGVPPDGKPLPPIDTSGSQQPAAIEEHWQAAEAIRTPAFWVLSAGLASMSMLGTGLTFHMVSIFQDNGLTADMAATAFMPIAMTAAAVTMLGGVLVDRIPVRFLLSVALLLQTLSLLMAPHLTGPGLALVYGVVLGITAGLQRTVGGVVWPTYFGRRYLGSITGVTTTIFVASSALGPMPMGIARDLLGSYNLVLLICAALPLALSVPCFFVQRPHRAALRR